MESEYVIQFNGTLKLTKSIFFIQFKLRVLFPLFKIGADLKFSPRVLQNGGCTYSYTEFRIRRCTPTI